MKELKRDSTRRVEETSNLDQGLSRPHDSRFEMVTGAPLNPHSDMMTGQMKPMMRQHEQMPSTAQQPNRPQLLILEEEYYMVELIRRGGVGRPSMY